MAAWYFLIYFLAIPSCLVSGQSPTFGLKGGKVFLKPDITGHPDGIRWKFKGNTVVEFEAQVQQVFRPYQNRITLNWVTAELNIADLRLEDSGDYELEVEINNALHTSYYALEVMDKVSRPTISCKMNDGGSLNVSGELVCSAEPQPSLKFEWGARGNVQLGPQLQIPLGDEHDDEVYSCSVSNQLSKETTTFTAKDCYPEGSSSAVPITIAVIIVLVLLLGCVAIHCFKRHNKACFAEEDDLEKQSLSGCKENEMTKQEEIPNKGSNKREGQNDEKRSLVHRESTLPSKQKLFQGNKYRRTNTFPDKQNEATDLDHKEPVKEAEAQSTPRVEAPPAAQALSPLTKSSLNTAPKDPAGGQKDVANSGQVTGDSAQNEVGESESGEGKRNESDDSGEDKPMSNAPEQRGSRTSLEPEENNTSKESQKVNVEPVPEGEDTSKTNAGDHEETDTQQHLYSANSEQFQSPRTKPDHSITDDGPESSDTKPAQPEAPPTAQALSPLTKSSLNTAPKDPAGGLKDVANSGQVTGDSAQNEVGGSESGEGKRNESEDSTDHKQRGSTASIETDVHLSQGENNTSKESQTVNVKPVSGDEDESTTNAGDHEETDTQQHLNSANSEQTQSPRTKPDHSNTDAGPVSSDTKPAQPDEEEEHETSTDSQDTEGQSDEGEKKIVEDKSKTNAGEHEETDTQQHLNSANSEQTQSPRTKPDHSNTDAGPVSSDTKPAQPDEEEEHETSTDSQDPEGQSDEGEKKIVEDKSKTNAGEHEETDTQQHLNSANSEQTQSPRTKPDHSNTDAGPVSSDTKPAQPDEEEEHETSTDSQDTEGQSDEGEDKTVEDRNEA
uniref:Ig-like domain-containing protein n=1 Tax=Gasterosteus aculeatus aculeatus TaxID=481459 RepID=A0AAQ4Q496_GASAC